MTKKTPSPAKATKKNDTPEKKSEFTDRRNPADVELQKAYALVAAHRKEQLQNLGKETKQWFNSLTNEQAGNVAVQMDQVGIMSQFRQPVNTDPAAK